VPQLLPINIDSSVCMRQTYRIAIALVVALSSGLYNYQQRLVPGPTTNSTMSEATWHFTAQRGFFSHDDDPASWEFRATTRPSLGLLERSYPTDNNSQEGVAQDQWSRFQHYIKSLNNEDPENKRYKLLYLIRHGQGVHNVKETEVGREEWNVRPCSSPPTPFAPIHLTAPSTAPLCQTCRRLDLDLARRLPDPPRHPPSPPTLLSLDPRKRHPPPSSNLLQPAPQMSPNHQSGIRPVAPLAHSRD
jgi:hypothetical protein